MGLVSLHEEEETRSDERWVLSLSTPTFRERACEGTGEGGRLRAGRRPQRKPTLTVPRSWTFSLRTVKKWTSVV